MTERRQVPLLVLDLDGTVRRECSGPAYTCQGPDDVEVFPEAVVMMRRWKDAGGRIVGVSNQGGLALGHVTLAAVSAGMDETGRQSEGLFDSISFCAHHPRATAPDAARCWCRKPAPGLLIKAALDLSRRYDEWYPPYMGLMVGDRPEDQECARIAGFDFEWAADWRTRAEL